MKHWKTYALWILLPELVGALSGWLTRNDTQVYEETIQRRLKRAEAEIANSVNYDEHVVNIEVDSCAESLYSIIQFKLQHGSDE